MHKVSLAATDQDHVLPRTVDGSSRCTYPLDCYVRRIEHSTLAVFYGQARYACFYAPGDIARHTLGIVGKARLKISVHGQIGCRAEEAKVIQHLFHAHFSIRLAQSPGSARAC